MMSSKTNIGKCLNTDTARNIRTYLFSIVAITLWGSSYIWSDCLIGMGVSIFYFVFIRILIAGILLLVFNAATRKLQALKKADLPEFLLLAFCEPFLYFICETYGIKETGSPTISAMAIATIPLFSLFAGVVFFKEKINWLNIVGVIASLGGIVLVAMANGTLGDRFILGILFLLVAVIAEVCHASITKRLSKRYSSQNIVMYQFLIGSVYLLPPFIFKGLDNYDAAVWNSWAVWKSILFLAVLCSSLAFTLWVGTIKQLGVAKSSIFSALIPVASAVIAMVCGSEFLDLRQWAGVAICTAGVIMSQMTLKKERTKRKHSAHGRKTTREKDGK